MADLSARIAHLEAENARLRQQQPAFSPVAEKRSRWWAALSAFLIVTGLVLGTAGIVASSAKRQLTDTDAFVAMLAPLAHDPDVQSVVITGANDAIDQSVNIAALTTPVFDGLADLELPKSATTGLEMLRARSIRVCSRSCTGSSPTRWRRRRSRACGRRRCAARTRSSRRRCGAILIRRCR